LLAVYKRRSSSRPQLFFMSNSVQDFLTPLNQAYMTRKILE